MRILFCHLSANLLGGAESHIAAVMEALAASGQEPALLHERPHDPSRPPIVAQARIPSWYAAEGGAALDKCIDDWQPQLVYVHDFEDLDRLARLAERYPVVLFAHAFGGLCVSGTRRFALPAVSMCPRRFGAGCLACYFPRRCGGLSPITMWRRYRAESRRQDFMRRCARILVSSRYMMDLFLQHGFSPERLALVPLATLEAPDLHEPMPRPFSNRVAFVGRMVDLKGTRLLAEITRQSAARLGRPLTLLLLGDGPERAATVADCRRLDVPVEDHGWVTADERKRLLRTVDLLVVPSLWPEPFGLVGIEAGCVGVPAAAFAVGGIPEWLEAGVSGELAPSESLTSEALAAAVARALGDEEHWQRLRIGAWRVSQRFTIEQHVQRLMEVLGQVVAEAPSPIRFTGRETNRTFASD